jgi:hypothetical protein
VPPEPGYAARVTADLVAIAATFADRRQRDAALVEQAQSWTGQGINDLGTFDASPQIDGDELGNVYARLVALSIQRLRVVSDQLARAFAEHGVDALVKDRLAYNPGTEELEVIGEQVSALAELEGRERRQLQELLTAAVRLRLETRSAEAIAAQGQRMAALAQALCEEVGLDWNTDSARRVAQRAVIRAEAAMARPA